MIDSTGTEVVKYTYDAWGKPLSTTGSLAATLGTVQPFRYRGYVYDLETGLYYLRARYYNSNWNRFINADTVLVNKKELLFHSSYHYCANNPIARIDESGNIWETILDIFSLGASIVEVCMNPSDPWAWAGLVGDVVDLVPFVTGVGETARAIKTTTRIVDKVDDVVDAAKATYRAADAASAIKKSTGVYEIIYKNGMNYVGKGGYRRAIRSAVFHADDTSDVISIMWKAAPNAKEAFIEEYALQTIRGVNNPSTYNKIWSPGKLLHDLLGK